MDWIAGGPQQRDRAQKAAAKAAEAAKLQQELRWKRQEVLNASFDDRLDELEDTTKQLVDIEQSRRVSPQEAVVLGSLVLGIAIMAWPSGGNG